MTGPGGGRVYLDWNATAPLKPEARAAILSALDATGNPSSVHTEGRAAKAIVEKARGQVAALAGCVPSEVVFTGSATEAAALMAAQFGEVLAAAVEHDSVWENRTRELGPGEARVGGDGVVHLPWAQVSRGTAEGTAIALQAANSETGVLQPVAENGPKLAGYAAPFVCDAVQQAGKLPFDFRASGAVMALLSAHKIGGPKGVGALIVRDGTEVRPLHRGGGQEMRMRSGTENVAGIAGFGAAAEAAVRDLADGAWDRVAKLRDLLEAVLAEAAPNLHIIAKGAQRLPNTSCFAVPGWKGETQVMQIDLAGFAVSAGSACSSGKVRQASRVLLAMGFDAVTASSAIRVSLGPTTTEAEVMGFADAWIEHYRRRRERAA